MNSRAAEPLQKGAACIHNQTLRYATSGNAHIEIWNVENDFMIKMLWSILTVES